VGQLPWDKSEKKANALPHAKLILKISLLKMLQIIWKAVIHQHLGNCKHVTCFYRLIETRVEVWENEKCCFHNLIETRRTCFLFLLENTATKKGNNLLTLIINM